MVGRIKINIDDAYKNYVSNMESRIRNNEKNKAGEPLKVKPKTEWVRTVTKKDKSGKDVEETVSGESGESRQEKAKRLGNSRLQKVLKDLDNLKTLAESNQYEFSESQSEYITEKVNDACVNMNNAFAGKSGNVETVELPD